MSSQLNLYQRFNKSIHRYNWLIRGLAFFSLYAIWILGFRLLTLTIITFFSIAPTARFQDISEAFGSNEISLMGLSAFLFVGLLYWLNPLNNSSLRELITRDRIEKKFLPGFIRGAIFAGGIVFLFVLIGVYRYLGYFIQFDEAPLELANVFLRMAALGILAYCEEYIFHSKLIQQLQGRMPDLGMAILIASLYSGIKILQFDLGLMQLVTLFLISICLFYRSNRNSNQNSNNDEFALGAGFWAAMLIVFQPVLSLPLFGNDFSGLLLIRYNSLDPFIPFLRILSGGAGGPLSSFAFQLVLILDISRKILTRKTTT
jgi:branched-subunit amino acid transport protein AzlD